jgi:hypothetical protein
VACWLTLRSPDFACWESIFRPNRCLWSRKPLELGRSGREPASSWPVGTVFQRDEERFGFGTIASMLLKGTMGKIRDVWWNEDYCKE